jgi:hypothetical protein
MIRKALSTFKGPALQVRVAPCPAQSAAIRLRANKTLPFPALQVRVAPRVAGASGRPRCSVAALHPPKGGHMQRNATAGRQPPAKTPQPPLPNRALFGGSG